MRNTPADEIRHRLTTAIQTRSPARHTNGVLDALNGNECHYRYSGGHPTVPGYEGGGMSLQVSTALLDRAKAGPVDDAEFIACVRDSLPYAWSVVSAVAERLHNDGGEYADDNTTPPGDAEQGQLLRALASSSMRGALERHFGVKLEFQNCCRLAAFRPDTVNSTTHREYISPRSQLLNQSPQLLSC
jgi:hypothetical protein